MVSLLGPFSPGGSNHAFIEIFLSLTSAFCAHLPGISPAACNGTDFRGDTHRLLRLGAPPSIPIQTSSSDRAKRPSLAFSIANGCSCPADVPPPSIFLGPQRPLEIELATAPFSSRGESSSGFRGCGEPPKPEGWWGGGGFPGIPRCN